MNDKVWLKEVIACGGKETKIYMSNAPGS